MLPKRPATAAARRSISATSAQSALKDAALPPSLSIARTTKGCRLVVATVYNGDMRCFGRIAPRYCLADALRATRYDCDLVC